jgi:hypothetical protein
MISISAWLSTPLGQRYYGCFGLGWAAAPLDRANLTGLVLGGGGGRPDYLQKLKIGWLAGW